MANLPLPRQSETLSCVGFVVKFLQISVFSVDTRGAAKCQKWDFFGGRLKLWSSEVACSSPEWKDFEMTDELIVNSGRGAAYAVAKKINHRSCQERRQGVRAHVEFGYVCND